MASPLNAAAAGLEQLRDIHQPLPLASWPWAPGWYGLFVVLVLVLMGLIWFGWRYYRNGMPKREALKALVRCEIAYGQTADSQQASATLMDLLKRVALAYFPRERVAQLYGEAWLDFLHETAPSLDFVVVRDALLLSPYRPHQDEDLTVLFRLARSWIKQRRRPCLS